jgi:hypothetical protein
MKLAASSRDEQRFLAILMLAFAVRAALACVLVYTHWIPARYYYDSTSYHLLALKILAGESVTETPPVIVISRALAAVYFVLGPAPIVASLLASVAGVVTVRNIYRIAEWLQGPPAALFVAATWAFLPSVVFVSSQPLRDPILHLLITTLIWWFIRIERGPRLFGAYITGCFIVIHVIYMLRPHQAFFLLLAVTLAGLSAFMTWSGGAARHRIRTVGLIGAAFLMIHPGGIRTVLPYRMSLLPDTAMASREHFIHPRVQYIDPAAAADADGTELYLAGTNDAGILSMVKMLPVRSLVFLLSPLPWQMHSTFLVVAMIETWILYAFLILGALEWFYNFTTGAWGIPQTRSAILLAVYVLVSVAVYGALEGNVGTAYRHRLQFEWILIIPGSAYLIRCMTAKNVAPARDEQSHTTGAVTRRC